MRGIQEFRKRSWINPDSLCYSNFFSISSSLKKGLAKKISKNFQALQFCNSFTTYFTWKFQIQQFYPNLYNDWVHQHEVQLCISFFNSVSALGNGALLENNSFSNFKSTYPFRQLSFGSPLLKATVLYTSPFKHHCVESSKTQLIYPAGVIFEQVSVPLILARK